ncbi:MAG: ATP-binding cassette domain-containing protein [Acidimicrobiia bacterium]|nr:ATP-binding cassette domain-containing protein [Acidimicrobiia bacterium]
MKTPPLIRPFSSGIMWSAIWSVVAILAEVGVVITIGRAIDIGSVSLLNLVTMLALYLIRSFARGLEERMGEHVASEVRVHGVTVISEHMMKVGPALADEQRTGDLVSRSVPGMDAVAKMAGRFLPMVSGGLTASIIIAVIVLFIDIWAGLALLVSLPLIPLVLRGLESRFRATADELRSASNTLTAQFLDTFQGLTTLKMFDRGADRGTVLAEDSERLRRKTMDLLRVNQTALIIVDLVQGIVSTMVMVGVLWFRVEAGAMTVGQAAMVALLAWLAVLPYVRVVQSIYLGALGLAALRQVRELLSLPVVEQGTATPSHKPDGSILLDRVTFRYGDGIPAIDDISVEIEAGSRVAVIGESGSGKSTLAAVLLGLRVPQEGSVIVGGKDRSLVDQSWLARAITYVGQDTHIFSMSVADNLRIAKPDATAGELIEVCRLAEIHDLIATLDRGYETILDERGTTLSVGEAQRIAIARAFLADTPIIIADEATAGLDLQTERRVTLAMERVTRGRTLVLIAHRRSTIVDADRVIVLSRGRVVEDGRPADVMSRSPLLAAMSGRHQK